MRRILPNKSKNWRYVFVIVRTLAEKYPTELYGTLKKTNKRHVLEFLRGPDHLLFSQWILG